MHRSEVLPGYLKKHARTPKRNPFLLQVLLAKFSNVPTGKGEMFTGPSSIVVEKAMSCGFARVAGIQQLAQ